MGEKSETESKYIPITMRKLLVFSGAEYAFDIFADGENLLDAIKVGKCLRALNLNPSLARLEELGISNKEGEKKFKLDELLKVFTQLKKEKDDQGCYEDFIEYMKLFDVDYCGKISPDELHHSLLNLGEKLTEQEVNELFQDCLGEEDEEGEIEYIPFLKRMCGLEPPLKPKKKK